MPFVARKPFTFKGHHYRPGDVVKGFPKDFFRPETFIRTGMIVETAKKKPGPKPKPEPVVEAVEEPIEEPAPEVEIVEGETLEAEEPLPEPEPADPVEE